MTAGFHTALYVVVRFSALFAVFRPFLRGSLCVYAYLNAVSLAGNRSIRPHGEDHGSDSAGVWHGARGDRITQRCRGYHQPSAHSLTEKGENEGIRCFSVC